VIGLLGHFTKNSDAVAGEPSGPERRKTVAMSKKAKRSYKRLRLHP
jgi:hypothetical protein